MGGDSKESSANEGIFYQMISQLICEVERFEKTNNDLEERYNNLAYENEELKHSFEKVTSDEVSLTVDNDRLSAQRDSCNREVKRLKDECRTLEDEKMQIDKCLNNKVKDIKDECDRDLKTQVLKYERKNSEGQDEQARLKRDITRLEAEVVKLTQELEHNKRDAEDKMKDLEAQSLEQCQILRSHIESADFTAATEMDKNEKLKGQVAKLIREVVHLKQGSTPQDPHFSKESSQKIHQEIQDLSQKCKDAERAIHVKDLTIKDLSTRLSSEMGKKVSTDEKCLENINIKNRPMNVATEYENICSSEWLEAKGILDEQLSALTEEKKAMFLRLVFFITEQEATGKIRAFNSQLLHLFNSPLDHQGEDGPMKTNELSIEMSNAAGDLLRSRADSTDVSCIIQMTNNTIAKEFPAMHDLVYLDGMQQYVRACSRLAWKMVIQRPAMGFVEKGLGEPWRGANQQEVCWYSADPSHPESRVDYFIHPALCHGNTPMVKGRVHLSST